MPLPLDILRRLEIEDSAEAWQSILRYAWELFAQPIPSDAVVSEVMRRERESGALDLFLATAGYDLWSQSKVAGLLNSHALASWWKDNNPGRAILILDGLSLREVPWILEAARSQGYSVHSAHANLSELPPETTPFAKALGFSQRSALEANAAGLGHHFQGATTEASNMPWAECVAFVGSYSDFVLWHYWPDSRIHDSAGAVSLESLARMAAEQLTSKDFWLLINRLTVGRRLVITSDHGYAGTGHYQNTEDAEQAKYLQQSYSSGRSTGDGQMGPWIPPLDLRIETAHGPRRMVLGRRKWKSPGGYPSLTHGGLSLLEVAVPFIEISRS
jgi:hypothetical protein